MSDRKSLSIIVSKGTLDWAYPPFILATTAAAMDMDATLFFTFYGLGLLKKKLDLEVSPLGNPAMKMPMGGMHLGMPNLVAGLPGLVCCRYNPGPLKGGNALIGKPEEAREAKNAVKTTDCLPVLLVDRKSRAVAAIHAGWRGTAASIVGTTLARMRSEAEAAPAYEPQVDALYVPAYPYYVPRARPPVQRHVPRASLVQRRDQHEHRVPVIVRRPHAG